MEQGKVNILEKEGKFLRKLLESTVKCPICNYNEMKIVDYLYEMPYLGKVLLSAGKCPRCGFKFNDVRVFEASNPKKIIFKVDKPEDLNALIVRASSASIKIPELGLELTPGPTAQGFITTIEGLLYMFKEITEFLCSQPDADKRACEKRLKEITEAIDGKRTFTLIVLDPKGVSKIVHEKVVEEPLG